MNAKEEPIKEKTIKPDKKVTSTSTTTTISDSSDEITRLKSENAKLLEKVQQYDKRIEIFEFSQSNSTPSKDVDTTSDDNFIIDEETEKSKYIKVGKIGEGSTSITFKLIDKDTKKPICKKVIKYKNGEATVKDAQRSLNEFDVMRLISHPCICKAYFINTAEPIEGKTATDDDNDNDDDDDNSELTTISIFIEFVDYKLGDLLKAKILNNTTKAKIVLEIVHGMKHLHKKGMMHRDLKIENIMVNSLFNTKLVDFGLVRITESILDGFSFVEDSLTKGVGTLSYMSPEMANEEEYDNKTDVYSFGIVLYCIFVGSLPKQPLREKMNGKPIKLPSPSEKISKFCIDLIKQCLSFIPSKRPSFEEILTQLRENSYDLGQGVDPIILSTRDNELEYIENNK